MMTYMKASEIKAQARGKMLGKYNTASAAFVLIQVIVVLVNLIVTNVVDVTTAFGTVTYGIINIIVELILTVFLVGELTIYLNFACGNKAKATDIFSYFKVHPDKAIMMEISIALRLLVYMILIAIGIGIIAIYTDNALYMMIGIILVLAGCALLIKVFIDLSQAFYLLLDFPQYTVKELLTFSREMMKGHRGTFIRLYLGFIPYILLGVASAGIGMLFVYPYIRMALTEFYLDIIREPADITDEM